MVRRAGDAVHEGEHELDGLLAGEPLLAGQRAPGREREDMAEGGGQQLTPLAPHAPAGGEGGAQPLQQLGAAAADQAGQQLHVAGDVGQHRLCLLVPGVQLAERLDEPARLLEVVFPAGFERYFTEMATLLDAHGPDFGRISALAAGYHLSFQSAPCSSGRVSQRQ